MTKNLNEDGRYGPDPVDWGAECVKAYDEYVARHYRRQTWRHRFALVFGWLRGNK
jgi:hypothetical protein